MRIEYDKFAIKQIASLDKNTQERIITSIQKLPNGDIKKLKGLVNRFRLRVGDYRVLYTMIKDLIIINEVLPRGEAYKNI